MLNIENTFSNLRDIIGIALPGVEFDLLIYGSAVNGLGVRSGESDLDLSLLVKSTLNEDDLILQQQDELKILLRVASYIQRGHNRYTAKDPYTTTFGHLLEIYDSKFDIQIELTLNKIVEVYNSWLIYQYAVYDSRFQSLAILLKLWNKKNFSTAANNANKFIRLNSYSLTLMLVAYL